MRLLLPFLGLAMLLSGCSQSVATDLQDIALIGPNQSIIAVKVEVADSQDEWAKGLSNRKQPLSEGTGMLFVFPEEHVLQFWMKDTHFPLDIIFFNALGKVVSYTQMVPCEKDPCPRYSSEVPALSALEVPVGFASKNGIAEGWQLALPAQ